MVLEIFLNKKRKVREIKNNKNFQDKKREDNKKISSKKHLKIFIFLSIVIFILFQLIISL